MSIIDQFWGVVGHPALIWPDSPIAFGLLLLSIGLLGWSLAHTKTLSTLRSMSRVQWQIFLVLCGASLLVSQLFPLIFPWSDPLLRSHPAVSIITLLSAVPYLLAGVALNVPAAIIVGLLAGLGRAAGQTGYPIDVIGMALAAGLSAVLMRQHYAGRLFELVRQPIIAGVLGRMVMVSITSLAVFSATLSAAGFFGALDLALFVGLWSALPLIIEGAVGGAVTSAILWIVPQWRLNRGLVPSPMQRSLQRQLVIAFVSFAVVVVLLSVFVAFRYSARSAERVLVEQMVGSAESAATRLAAMQTEMTDTLTRYGADPALAAAAPDTKSTVLGRIQTNRLFDRIVLVDERGTIIPDRVTAKDVKLSATEQEVVSAALAGEKPRWVFEGDDETTGTIHLAVSGTATNGLRTALLARVSTEALTNVIEDLHGSGGQSYGFLVDETSRVVTTPVGAADDNWLPPGADQTADQLSALTGRAIYESQDPSTGARNLVSITTAEGDGWKVVAVLPRAAILRQTLSIIGPLLLLLLAVSTLFYVLVAALGRSITQPIAEIGRASKAIAGGGGLERPVRSHREDEIGQLTLAFSQMQRALRQRLDELSLLLSVSNDVAATMNINEGMAAVLQGVLRGTGAAGARAIVRNPNTPAPLVFAEGPAADGLSAFDRPLLLRLRSSDELAYSSTTEIEEALEINGAPVGSLLALPLRPAGEFQGVLYVAYRQPHYFDSDERNLLRTLAGQATVLVQNAHLFAAAEGGRRRLAAILASTTNGVLVTDQTDRILLINPAMERALGISGRDAIGRPVIDALAGLDKEGLLARRLSLGMSAATGGTVDGKLELEVNSRVYLAGISTVSSHEGQTLGRVAVLQDVTDIKALDRLKSDFIAGISHDLLSPLTYMHNYAAMLPINDDPELEKEYTDKIMLGIDRMKQLVNDLLELARIEAGINLQFDRVYLPDLLHEIVMEYASPAKSQGITLIVEAEVDLPPAVADPTLLRRAITNLVTNGLKHAPNSGPMVLRVGKSAGELVISVKDQGPGIPLGDQAHLFEKFYQGQGLSTAERGRGSGLGLAIVKSVADHHHGRVWCESSAGEGSTFFLALPLTEGSLHQ